MKLAAVLLCTFVVGALGTFRPVVKSAGGVAGKAAFGLGKVGTGALKTADQVKGTNHRAQAAQQWESHDVKKTSVDTDYEKQGERASHDAKSAKQAHGNAASGWNQAHDNADKVAAKAGAASSSRDAKDKWASNNQSEKNQAWAGNNGWKKNNKKHEGIAYSFDKKFRSNKNDNGGFKEGHNFVDHALNDVGHQRSSYGKVAGDHGAKTAHAQGQSADRSSGWGDGYWKNAQSADRHGRDRAQAAKGHGNDRDWAEKRDAANNVDRYNRYGKARAADVLNKQYELDRNAGRDTIGYGAAAKGVVAPVGKYGGYGGYGAGYGGGYGGYGGYGKKAAPYGLKGINSAKGVADRSNLWDSANTHKNQDWLKYGEEDSNKQGALANQWQEDQLKGWNNAQNGWKNDKGFAQDAAANDQGARAANQQWADAGSARTGHQGRYDLDEVIKKKTNNQWNKSDRNKRVNDYKKFFSNDKKGGQNWERLKFKKDQTEDANAADWATNKDNANRWQSAHKFDANKHAAHSADTARAHDGSQKHWSSDAAKHSNGAQAKAGDAADGSNGRVWGATNDRRKYAVDQALDDARKSAKADQDLAGKWEGYDARTAAKGAREIVGAKGYPGYGNYGYPGNQGGYGGYGKGYGGGYGGYGKGYGGGYGSYGGLGNNGYGGLGNKGYGGLGNKGYGGYGGYGKGYGDFPGYY